jgi:hypothetical protein
MLVVSFGALKRHRRSSTRHECHLPDHRGILVLAAATSP